MTFDELKRRSADDLREIAKFLEKRATQIEAGDLQVMDHLVDDEWQRWYEMLLIRYSWGQEQRKDAGYREPSKMCPECKAVGGPDGVTNCATCRSGFWDSTTSGEKRSESIS